MAEVRRRLLFGPAAGAANRSLTLFAWLVITPLILASIGDEAYGLWVLVGTIASYGYLLDLGMGGAIVKYLAEHFARGDDESASVVLSTAMLAFALLGLACLGGGIVVAALLPPVLGLSHELRTSSQVLIVLVVSSVALALASAPLSLALRGLQQHGLFNTINLASNLALVALSAVVLLAGGGLLAMVAVNIPLILVSAAAYWVVVRRVAPRLTISARLMRRREAAGLLRFSSWVFAQSASGQLQQKSDEIVIAAFLPIASVTPYALARRLGQLAFMLATQFSNVLLPLASELDARADMDRLRALLIGGTRVLLAVFMPLAIVLTFLAEPILRVWVGIEYVSAAVLVVILTAAGLVGISVWPAAAVLTGMARHRFVGAVSIANGVANIVLSVMLVEPLGLVGVALGTLIPTSIEAVLLTMPYAMRQLSIRPGDLIRRVWMPVLLPAVPASLAVIVASRLVDLASLVGILGAAAGVTAIYFGVYLLQPQAVYERGLVRWALSTGLRVARPPGR